MGRPVQVRPGRLRPVQHGQGGVPQGAPQLLLELTGRPDPTQLDHQSTGRGVSPLRFELAGDEPDGHDAVLLGGVQQSLTGALSGCIVLEIDLLESGERVAHVRLVVDGKPPPAARVDVGECAVREARPFAGAEPGHALTIDRSRISLPVTLVAGRPCARTGRGAMLVMSGLGPKGESPMRTMILVALSGLLISACGGGAETLITTTTRGETTTTIAQQTTTTEETTTTARETTTTAEAALQGAAVATADSELGTILVDQEGLTLYILTADEQGPSTCYDDCAGAWPPFTTEGDPQAGAEVDPSLLGTTARDDGTTQVSYNGWPLYHFFQDEAPGEVNGQGIQSFGGTWWVIGPDGMPIQQG